MNALKKIRIEKKLSQKELADAIGVSPISISRYERNERKLSVPTAQKISAFLNIHWTCLYDEKENGDNNDNNQGRNNAL